MLEQLRKRPSLKVLEDLGLCLAYRSTTWLSLYCRLGGVGMQLEVLFDFCRTQNCLLIGCRFNFPSAACL